MFGLVTLGLGIGALGRNPAIIVGFLIVCSVHRHSLALSPSRFQKG
jgi:hypothetical protein